MNNKKTFNEIINSAERQYNEDVDHLEYLLKQKTEIIDMALEYVEDLIDCKYEHEQIMLYEEIQNLISILKMEGAKFKKYINPNILNEGGK